MATDAHVHMGYYPRLGRLGPCYYSPQRIVGVLNRCGVEHFIVSSTCAQMEEINIEDILHEAREIKRVAGERAHIFFWLSGHLYDEDRSMQWMGTGLFEGIKFHEGETKWLRERKSDLVKIIESAATHGYNVQFHCDGSDGCNASQLAEISCLFPSVNFDFAHCRPMKDLSRIVLKFQNVWTDTAYMDIRLMSELMNFSWNGRLMFGTDLPVWQAHERVGLSQRYRSMLRRFENIGLGASSDVAFKEFLNKK